MDLVREGLEVFKKALPPALAGYWAALFAGLVILQVLLLFVVTIYCMRRKAKGRTVCLLGLSDSGKTLLFFQLNFRGYAKTQNSMLENSWQYEPLAVKKSRPVSLVDVPGDERVRERLFSKYKDSLRGVVVVIDSLNFPSQVHDVAELMYDLLSDAAYYRSRAPLLVACNKHDMALASPSDAIMQSLEKQITQLQVSRKAKPSALDGGPKAQKPVEFFKKGATFRFSDLPSWMGVRFVECSARGQGMEGGDPTSQGAEEVGGKGKAQIQEVREWVDGLCY